MKFVKLEDVEKILGDIYESMGSSRNNWCAPLRKNDVEEWWWSDDKNNDFVKHAQWIETEDLSGDHFVNCSNCDYFFWLAGEGSRSAEWNYCPKCGAKMDGGTHED